jgi:hypothetical protein
MFASVVVRRAYYGWSLARYGWSQISDTVWQHYAPAAAMLLMLLQVLPGSSLQWLRTVMRVGKTVVLRFEAGL